MAMNEQSDVRPPSLDLIYVEVKDRLDQQFKQIETITTRAGFITGFASLVLATLITIRKNMGELCNAEIILLGVAGVLYGLVLFFSYRAYGLKTYTRDPEPRPLRDGYLQKPEYETKRQILTQFIESFDHNTKIINERVKNLKRAIFSLFGLIIFLLALLFILTPEN